MSKEKEEVNKSRNEEVKSKVFDLLKGLSSETAYTLLYELQSEIREHALNTTIL